MRLITYFIGFLIVACVVLGSTTEAAAAGFSCMSVDRNERIDVYFESLEDGAEATHLIVSNPTVSKARQHTASFYADDGVLATDGQTVLASVNPALPGTSRKGERVGGTTLGALAHIQFEIDAPKRFLGTTYAGQAVYVKRNGAERTQDFDCVLFEGAHGPLELYF